MPGKQHQKEGGEAGAEAPEAVNREGKDQEEKDVEERPSGEPIALGPLGAEEGEEAPAGGEVEGCAEAFGTARPAGGWDLAIEGGAAGGF